MIRRVLFSKYSQILCQAPNLTPNKGLREAQTLGNRVIAPMGGWDERIFPVLDHELLKA